MLSLSVIIIYSILGPLAWLGLITGFFLGRSTAGGSSHGTAAITTRPATTTASAATPLVAEGKRAFATAGCGGCHTLSAAGATGAVGPNLDQARPSRGLVVDRVTHGKNGMPAFSGQLSPAQIRALATFISSSAGR